MKRLALLVVGWVAITAATGCCGCGCGQRMFGGNCCSYGGGCATGGCATGGCATGACGAPATYGTPVGPGAYIMPSTVQASIQTPGMNTATAQNITPTTYAAPVTTTAMMPQESLATY